MGWSLPPVAMANATQGREPRNRVFNEIHAALVAGYPRSGWRRADACSSFLRSTMLRLHENKGAVWEKQVLE